MAREGYTNVVRGSAEEIKAREVILGLFKETPIPDDEMLVNLGAYLRSPLLAKILYLNELYQLIEKVPGIIVEFGVWWGANLALFESFRAVYEPYNWNRKVVGFDTFQGYPSVGEKDGTTGYAAVGGYTVSEGYEDYLSRLLDAHEADNGKAADEDEDVHDRPPLPDHSVDSWLTVSGSGSEKNFWVRNRSTTNSAVRAPPIGIGR